MPWSPSHNNTHSAYGFVLLTGDIIVPYATNVLTHKKYVPCAFVAVNQPSSASTQLLPTVAKPSRARNRENLQGMSGWMLAYVKFGSLLLGKRLQTCYCLVESCPMMRLDALPVDSVLSDNYRPSGETVRSNAAKLLSPRDGSCSLASAGNDAADGVEDVAGTSTRPQPAMLHGELAVATESKRKLTVSGDQELDGTASSKRSASYGGGGGGRQPLFHIYDALLNDRLVPCVNQLAMRQSNAPPDGPLMVSLSTLQQCCSWASSVAALTVAMQRLPIQLHVPNGLQMNVLRSIGVPDPAAPMIMVSEEEACVWII